MTLNSFEPESHPKGAHHSLNPRDELAFLMQANKQGIMIETLLKLSALSKDDLADILSIEKSIIDKVHQGIRLCTDQEETRLYKCFNLLINRN